MPRRSPLLLLALLPLFAAQVGCNPTPSRGSFDAEALRYGTCDADIIPWEPAFSTIDQFENELTIRLESRSNGSVAVDTLVIQLDKAYALDHIGENLLLGLPEDNKLRTRATLGFFSSCPRADVTPELIGTLRFDFLEPRNDGQITGRITAPVVIDSRTGDVIGANFEGFFSFRVQKGRPYTNFTGPGQE